MSQQPTVLVIDDESGILDTIRILLKKEGYEVITAQGGKASLDAVRGAGADIVVTDVRMPQVTGLDILQAVKDNDPMTPVILMTAQASLQSAIQAVNAGAFYYLQKPFGNDELLAILRRACEFRKIRVENKQLKQEIRRAGGGVRDNGHVTRPIGKSRRFLEVLRLAELIAPTDSTVLIGGESGTGKEVLARFLHQASGRADGPFMSINCGALPETLLESELFGHVKGSFTGAVRDKQGLFAAARGGTFFMDEVGEMPPSLQVKLLRVLQQREVIPVGATDSIPVDVRIIAATNRDLEDEVRLGNFRSDLFYRLNVIAVDLPPLRDRRDDLILLIDRFLEEMTEEGESPRALSSEALDAVMVYEWPGNVRELQNALEHAVVLSRGPLIEPQHLPARITSQKKEPLVADRTQPNPTLDLIERSYIMFVLQAEGGNKTRAAEVLGIDPSTLYRKLSRYEGNEAPPK
ncbi:MAG: sigma-54 dependent transcriptional regulator [Gemmatimonadales bacterium]|nr:sigma-54 dependent transcriptional regulator [Gemmatimonadales bacterium]